MIQKLFDLTGKAALITGGSRGLGLEIAEGLAEAGAKLFLLARRAQWLDPAVADLRARGYMVNGALCDVTNPAEVKRVVTEAGEIDILVNNAGISWSVPAEDMPYDKWKLVMQTNLDGAFLFSQEAARSMIARGSGGVIINVASIAGLKGTMPGGLDNSSYVASKAALLALTRELAAKWAQHGIRVNAISPGFFPSRMTEKVIETKGEAEMAKAIPMRRIGRPGELKGVALFLACDASSYITGQNIVVDGGRTAV
jgi:NAD(P)-dependent dehydrogenase (short-subunit alcohol dehydrogenase family)